MPERVVQKIRQVTPKVGALVRPPAVEAGSLDLDVDEWVVGIATEREARGYPVSSLRWHHVINDLADGDPVAVTFCGKCFSALAFDPVVDGVTLTFEVYGMHEGNVVLRDAETGTLWGQLTGEGLAGPHAARRLPLVPATLTTWDAWLEKHPESLTPDPDVLAWNGRYGLEDFHWSERVNATLSRRDPRLDLTSLVLGVEVGGRAIAYSLDADRPGPRLAQDEVGGVPIALLAAPGAWPLAYDRRSGDGVVDLRLDGDRIVTPDGTTWTAEGVAVEGPRAGAALAFVPSRVCRWYAWSAYHPETEIAPIPPARP